MINIADLYSTQQHLKRANQVPAMIAFLLAGGDFSDNPVQLKLLSDERIVINNGHHRVTAIYCSGRRILYDNEYILDADDSYKRNVFNRITNMWWIKDFEMCKEPTEQEITKRMEDTGESFWTAREELRDLAYKDKYNKPAGQSWGEFWKSY